MENVKKFGINAETKKHCRRLDEEPNFPYN